MKVRINSEVEFGKWLDLLQRSKFASPFQSIDFYKLYNSIKTNLSKVYAIEESGVYTNLCVVTIQKEKGVKGFFSRRAIVYGGPLIESAEGLALILQTIRDDLKDQVIYFEIRNNFDYSDFNKVFESQSWRFVPYLNFELTTRDTKMERIISEMKYNRRREIRISMEEGANFEEAQSSSDVEALYSILNELYSTRVKLPLPDINYFLQLFSSSIGKVIVVKHSGQIIGGSFCYYLKDRSIYTLYYCGLRDYHKKIFPTHLAILGVIDFAIKNNLRTVDFMGAGKKGDEYGVRKYKEEFGGNLVEYGRFMKINKPILYQTGILGLALLKKVK